MSDTDANANANVNANWPDHELAGRCSLCAGGYHPNLEIDIAEEPIDGEYRWSHTQCKRDHARAFVEVFGA